MQTIPMQMLPRTTLEAWPEALRKAGFRVVVPVDRGHHVEYLEFGGESSSASGLGVGLPRLSPKGAWFPRSEPILRFRRENGNWIVEDPAEESTRVVVFGARPCDAAAPEIMAPLFGWDSDEVFFEERRKRLAFVVLGCSEPVDEACFCTSVGVDPAGVGLGDVLLTDLGDGRFAVEARTEVGRELLALVGNGEPATDEAPVIRAREKARAAVPRRFDPEAVQRALRHRFEDPIWERTSFGCLSCGTCSFSCPTCHCFDIQDEVNGTEGIRQKNWDACTIPLFTLHTSGHNPRPDRGSRWRQRLSHKFSYYPEKFGHTLCTGCGRCIRLCPGGLDMLEVLEELAGCPEAEKPFEPTQILQSPGSPIHLAQGSKNLYHPCLVKVASVRDETVDVRTLRLEFLDPKDAETFSFRVGQFGLYSALGEGESTFCIASSPTREGYLECTFREAGRVTKALRRLEEGDLMGFRGPYGNSFPVEEWKGKDVLFVAGGIGLAPVRSVMQYCLDRREDFGSLTLVSGAKTWGDHVYKHELAELEARPDFELRLCIDWKFGPGGPLRDQAALEGWEPLRPGAPAPIRSTCFVPELVEAVKPTPGKQVVVVCGPPIMINLTLKSLEKLGFAGDDVYVTVENRMKCGVGRCGRCNVGPVYLCKEGPVFTASQVKLLPQDM